tara:strand:- start:600 stop:1070 length:471 start_codon:yes stop_codon:yes gene_type:complete
MYNKIKPILVMFSFVVILPAQFKSDLQIGEIPTNLNGELNSRVSLSLFDPERFDMSHGLSMTMMSNGQNMYSLTGLTNRISYLVMDNLKIDANITLYKSQMPFQQQDKFRNLLDIAYDAGVTYKPTENSFLQIRFQNLPYNQRYQTRSPFNMRFIQ